MASVDELSAAVAAAKDAIEQNTGIVAAAIQQAEELSGQLAAMGVESKSAQAMQVKDSLEQMQAQLAALSSAADQVQAQAEAMRGLEAETGGAVSAGGAAPTAAGASAGGKSPPPTEPTPLASASNEPPDDSGSPNGFEPAASGVEYRTGDQLEPWEIVPTPPAVLEFEDEDDEFTRFARKGDDVSDGAKAIGDSLDNIVQGLERGPASAELRSITIRVDDAASTAIPVNPPPFSKGSLSAAVAVIGLAGVMAGRKLANRFGRDDG